MTSGGCHGLVAGDGRPADGGGPSSGVRRWLGVGCLMAGASWAVWEGRPMPVGGRLRLGLNGHWSASGCPQRLIPRKVVVTATGLRTVKTRRVVMNVLLFVQARSRRMTAGFAMSACNLHN